MSEKEIPNKAFWEIEFPKMISYLKKYADRIDEVVGNKETAISVLFRNMHKIIEYQDVGKIQMLAYHLGLVCLEISTEVAKKKSEKKIIVPDIDTKNIKLH